MRSGVAFRRPGFRRFDGVGGGGHTAWLTHRGVVGRIGGWGLTFIRPFAGDGVALSPSAFTHAAGFTRAAGSTRAAA